MPAKIAIVYYSTYNHVLTLAEAIKEGVLEAGVQVDIWQIPETLPANVLQMMHAPPKSDKYPFLQDPNVLKDYDGFLFGSPTRYGRVAAQLSEFFDSTGALWMSGSLVGKFGGIFTSTASQHGGQETTALTTLPFFIHHGISYVPIGYAEPSGALQSLSKPLGGTPYGASTLAGADGSRQVSEEELNIARYQGKYFATLVNTVVRGKEILENQSKTSKPTVSDSTTSEPEKADAEKPIKTEKKGFLSKILPCCGSPKDFDS